MRSASTHDEGVTRRAVLAGATGLAATGLVTPADAVAAAAGPLAEPSNGTSAAEVIGQIAQDGTTLTGYGYLTRLSGLGDAALFGATHDEAGARFTWSSTAKVSERFVRGTLISVTATGTLAFYSDSDGGTFGDPGSFSNGKRIAAYTARFQNSLTIVAPNQAVAAIEGELRQTAAAAFMSGGRSRRLGHRRLRLNLSATGPGVRTDATVPRAVFDVAGRLTVAG